MRQKEVFYGKGAARLLERVADHCTNICERVVFIVEGETEMHPTLEG